MANQSQAVSVFEFQPSFELRVIVIDGEPWFMAADVCSILELKNISDTLGKLDADEKGIASTYTLGGKQNVSIISESGLYTIILRHRDATKVGTVPYRFRKWVTSEVLPSIRKTGSYTVPMAKAAIETITPIQYHNLRVMVNSLAAPFHRSGSWEHWAWKHVRALGCGEVAAKLPVTMYEQAVNVLKALEVEASLYLAKLYDQETEFLRQDRAYLVQRVQMSLPLEQDKLHSVTSAAL